MTWPGSTSAERDLMRELFRRLGDDPEAVCLAYVEAERDGQVVRSPGSDELTPGTYAKVLWREGKLTGWLQR